MAFVRSWRHFAGFKAGVDGIDVLITKYKGKSITEIDQSLTTKEEKIIDESIKVIDEGSNALINKIKNSDVNELDLETSIKKILAVKILYL